jgi:hypothetical protein
MEGMKLRMLWQFALEQKVRWANTGMETSSTFRAIEGDAGFLSEWRRDRHLQLQFRRLSFSGDLPETAVRSDVVELGDA